MLVVPLIDGMNLIAKEYIAAHPNGNVLIISKNAGAAWQMQDALLVDSRSQQAITEALKVALTMPLSERRQRHKCFVE